MESRQTEEHPIDREAWQTPFCEILYQLGFDAYGCPQGRLDKTWRSLGYGHTNGDLTIRPYYWGDCRCGWDDAAAAYKGGQDGWSDYFEMHKKGPKGHAASCPIVLPNFVCKSLGLQICWYKTALRCAGSNQPLTPHLMNALAKLAGLDEEE